MNAAFLLVTTAWIAGADAAPAPAPAAAAPVYSVGTGGCASGGCSSGGCATCGSCDTCGEAAPSKAKGFFHHAKTSVSDCGCGCESEKSYGHTSGGHVYATGCGCEATCDSCGSAKSSGGGLREKLKGLFHHAKASDCGCEVSCGCDTCGGCAGGGCAGVSGGTVLTPIPGSTMPKETIGAPKEEPKKLPSGEKVTPEKTAPEKKSGSVQLIPQPFEAPALEIAPAARKSPF